MFCERCKQKTLTRRQTQIICKKCGKEVFVPLYNNNMCKECNEQAGTCEECGRKINNK